MHYKIVIVHDACPDKPSVYRGEYRPVEEYHPILCALSAEFGNINHMPNVVESLRDWSGGEVSYWATDLAEDPQAMDWQCVSGDANYYVFLGAGPLE